MEKMVALFRKYFVDVLKTQYADFNGRALRSQFWYFVLCYAAVSLIVRLADEILHMPVLQTLLALALLAPGLAIGARRLHDLGKTGWWQLLGLVPVVGWIILVFWFAMEGQEGKNAYGDPVVDA
ncbi:MAG: DUF805 domain-containing protein [Alphaproteobacteria bacterium]|nr:DUF805 domain-containing protein [Alphaproteobacteria bacterium]